MRTTRMLNVVLAVLVVVLAILVTVPKLARAQGLSPLTHSLEDPATKKILSTTNLTGVPSCWALSIDLFGEKLASVWPKPVNKEQVEALRVVVSYLSSRPTTSENTQLRGATRTVLESMIGQEGLQRLEIAHHDMVERERFFQLLEYVLNPLESPQVRAQRESAYQSVIDQFKDKVGTPAGRTELIEALTALTTHPPAGPV